MFRLLCEKSQHLSKYDDMWLLRQPARKLTRSLSQQTRVKCLQCHTNKPCVYTVVREKAGNSLLYRESLHRYGHSALGALFKVLTWPMTNFCIYPFVSRILLCGKQLNFNNVKSHLMSCQCWFCRFSMQERDPGGQKLFRIEGSDWPIAERRHKSTKMTLKEKTIWARQRVQSVRFIRGGL